MGVMQAARPPEAGLVLGPGSETLAYSVADAAAVSSVSPTLIKQQIAAGKLRARKAGRRTLILRAELERWLAALPAHGKGSS